MYYDAVALVSGTSYTFAFDFYGVYAAYFADTAGNLTAGTTSFSGSGQWTREVATYAATASANFRVEVLAAAASDTADIFYLDGCLVCALDHDPGYFDGDSDDCHWTGTPHASTSVRDAGSAQGGEVINFDDYYFYTSEWPGAGMAEVSPLLQQIGTLPGAIDAGEKINERVFTIVGTVIGTSQTSLHARRKGLINIFKSDRVRDKQQVTLVYSGGNSERPVRIRAKYLGGMTMGAQTGFSEKLGLRFVATDPFWYEDGNEGASFAGTHIATISDADYVIKRIEGVWGNVSTNFNSWVTNLVKRDGTVYIGGLFSAVGDTNGNYILSYNGTALSSMGGGLSDAQYRQTVTSMRAGISPPQTTRLVLQSPIPP